MEKDNFSMGFRQMKNQNQPRKQQIKPLPVQNPLDMKKIIQNYQFSLNHLIRKNKYSQVYFGKQINQQKSISIKVIPIQKTFTTKQRQQLQNEISKCKNLSRHKNIITILDVLSTTNNYYIMMQQCSTDLKTLLQKKKVFTEEQIISYILDILDGIRYFYNNNLIHCNIKPSNILIGSDGVAKITDFALTRKIQNDAGNKQDYQNDQWTPYMSPLTLVTKRFHQNNDAWAFAVLLYECLHGYQRYPWKFDTYNKLLQNIYESTIQYSKKISKQMTEFLTKCLNSKNNISVSDLYNDPFIKKLYQRKKGIQIWNNKDVFTDKNMSNQAISPQNRKQSNMLGKKPIYLGDKNAQLAQLPQMQLKKTNSHFETLESPTKISVNNNNKKIPVEQIIESQFSFMRFVNIILKQDQKGYIPAKFDPNYAQMQQKRQLDHKFFRFVLIKQNLIQKQNLKITLDPYSEQNPINIPNVKNLLKNKQIRQRINSYRIKLREYDIKYEPIQKQMQKLSIELTEKFQKTKPQWRSRDILNQSMQRKQIFAILGVRLSRQSCIYLWRQIQLSLPMIQDPQYQLSDNHKHQLTGQIKQKLMRIDFLMSYYIINCLLLDNFSDPEYFTRNCGLNIIMNVVPEWPQIEHVGLIHKKLQMLQIV